MFSFAIELGNLIVNIDQQKNSPTHTSTKAIYENP
jgi:hypothetical protein